MTPEQQEMFDMAEDVAKWKRELIGHVIELEKAEAEKAAMSNAIGTQIKLLKLQISGLAHKIQQYDTVPTLEDVMEEAVDQFNSDPKNKGAHIESFNVTRPANTGD